MKKFIINFCLFLLPLVAGYILLEKKLQKIPNSYNQKKHYLEQQLPDIEVLNLGASHALNGIDPQYFSYPGFNLANVSQTLYYDDEMLEQYVDKMPKLKMVIIPVSYFTLYRRLEDFEEKWRMYFYYYYWKIKVPNESVFDIDKYSLLTIYSPHLVAGFAKKGFNVNLAPQYSKYGFEGQDSIGRLSNLTEAMGKGRSLYHEKGYTPANVENGIAILDRMIKLLHNKNINVVLLTIPAYHTYYENNKPEILATNKRVVDSLCSKYGCKYYSYYKDSRFTSEDFANCDHLNSIGAMKFSKILDSEVLKPILK